jgi:hypothetical protein
MDEKAKLLVDHYQKTFELTYELWEQRNRTFLILIGVIGAATLLTFRIFEANSLLVDLVAKALNITDPNRVETLRKSFPFGILQSVLLFVIFYLMMNLYHRAVSVLRNYRYLGLLETEIRKYLNLLDTEVAFSREGNFYWHNRGWVLGVVKWIYFALLGALLLSFLVGKSINDISTGSRILIAVDALMGIPTLFFFGAYVKSSIRFDRATSIQNTSNQSDSQTSRSGAQGS